MFDLVKRIQCECCSSLDKQDTPVSDLNKRSNLLRVMCCILDTSWVEARISD